MSKSINASLYRPIKSGVKHDALMPFSDCSSIKLAEGDTKVAINNMAIWSRKYKHHTKNIAVTFADKRLSETCKEIHGFLFHHFQYKIDGSKQNLRSPACSWSSRQSGIDCKSYSIFASTILLNLGIKHYLRRIKQSATAGFSHVYVIVPKNQKNPKNLKNGYFTIDGTLPTIEEPEFYEKSDIYMEAELPIYGLAGTQPPVQNTKGKKQGDNYKTEIVKQIFIACKPLIDEAVKSLFLILTDCVIPEYELPLIKVNVEKKLVAPLTRKLELLDEAILFNNKPRIQHILNDIFKEVDLGIAHLRNEAAYLASDKCEGKTLATSLKYLEQIKKSIDAVYDNFIKSYKKYDFEMFTKTATTSERTLYFVVPNMQSPVTAEYRFIILRKNKSKYGIEPILPYGEGDETFEGTSNKWLQSNLLHLRTKYTDGRDNRYESEIKPYIEKVRNLRKSPHLGGEGLYLLEQPLQRDMYKIWLKYDTQYTDFLKKESKSLRTAIELAMRDFQIRLTSEVAKDKSIKQSKLFKKIFGFGILAFASVLIIKKQR
ncbi:hypothetical protein [Tenacibaculum dicentrarchi]|uniref:hypothetical protein n=1 Tax=Tenacibaculum dicentrarchi TaxID=669041 RepID=UPI00351522B6